MLILSRKLNESVVIDGRIVVRIMRVDGDVVKVGIEAPNDVPVHRQEVYEEIQRNNREALTNGRPVVPRLPRKQAVPTTAAGTPVAAAVLPGNS
ncbi:MAG TPA: carbon storage regulator CsrA [Verrucomicrobiae bacterium]|nr:carbon storage regulator CsrA [Verrucomicrobiae bacterium]